MVSIVIRNKNEAKSLKSTLEILKEVYAEDIDEIIVVDNKSTDESISVAKSFNCKIITIEKFTYGKAINLGIENAKNNLILLLSSHAVPVGNSFFKNSIKEFSSNTNLAGMRYINSFQNYVRANNNNFFVNDGLNFGLMAACAMVNKNVWVNHKFDEKLIASEDKEWSSRVINAGFSIKDFNETFFYHIKRDENGALKRWKIETIAHYQLHQLKFTSFYKIIAVFLKNIIFDIPKQGAKSVIKEIKLFRIKLQIRKILKKK